MILLSGPHMHVQVLIHPYARLWLHINPDNSDSSSSHGEAQGMFSHSNFGQALGLSNPMGSLHKEIGTLASLKQESPDSLNL